MLFKVIGQQRHANIHFSRIMYVESNSNIATFHMKDGGMISTYKSLVDVQQCFPSLYRISDCLLLNEQELLALDKIGNDAIFKLSNGEKLRAKRRSPFVTSFKNAILSNSDSGDEKGE